MRKADTRTVRLRSRSGSWGRRNMDGDDKLPRSTDIGPSRTPGEPMLRHDNFLTVGIIGLVVVLLAIGGVSDAFRSASNHLDAVRRDTAASASRITALGAQLAQATNQRDRSLHEAALHRVRPTSRHAAAHAHSAAALKAELADLDAARAGVRKSR